MEKLFLIMSALCLSAARDSVIQAAVRLCEKTSDGLGPYLC